MSSEYDELDHMAETLTKEQMQWLFEKVPAKKLLRWWFISFEEHTSCCDMCTLTWSADHCDEYKILGEFIKEFHT